MVMDQFTKHSSLQHRFENHVDCIAKVLYHGQWVVEHRFQPVSCRIQMRVKLFDVDPLTCIEQGNWGDVICGIQRDEDLCQAVKDCRGLQSCKEVGFAFLRAWVFGLYCIDHR